MLHLNKHFFLTAIGPAGSNILTKIEKLQTKQINIVAYNELHKLNPDAILLLFVINLAEDFSDSKLYHLEEFEIPIVLIATKQIKDFNHTIWPINFQQPLKCITNQIIAGLNLFIDLSYKVSMSSIDKYDVGFTLRKAGMLHFFESPLLSTIDTIKLLTHDSFLPDFEIAWLCINVHSSRDLNIKLLEKLLDSLYENGNKTPDVLWSICEDDSLDIGESHYRLVVNER